MNTSTQILQTNILVITPQYAPDFGPSVPIFTALCEDLQRMGNTVTVITAFPHNLGADAKKQSAGKFFEETELNGVKILRVFIYAVPKGALWRRLLYHASFNIFATLALFRLKKPSIVLADAPTLWSGLPLLFRSVLLKIPFVYIVHDVYPDVLLRLGVVRNLRLIDFIEKVEQFFYRRAVAISVLSDGFKENLSNKGVPEEKLRIIPACVDTDFIRPLEKENDLRREWGLNGKFVVLYAGNIGLSQGLEIMIEAAITLKSYSNIEFVIVGEGAKKTDLMELVEKENLKNVKFQSFQPREVVPLVYALADVCLVSLKRDIVLESVPSKTYSIMSSGRPIIATVDPNTEVGHLLKSAACGLCIPPENSDALAQAILDLFKNVALRDEMGFRGREYVVQKYSRMFAASAYYDIIREFSK
jgi:colanic acid biosynthesis glycosyl transferase WcaI